MTDNTTSKDLSEALDVAIANLEASQNLARLSPDIYRNGNAEMWPFLADKSRGWVAGSTAIGRDKTPYDYDAFAGYR